MFDLFFVIVCCQDVLEWLSLRTSIFVPSQESASGRFSVAENRTGWWCQTRGATAQRDLLSSLSHATLNVNLGLHHHSKPFDPSDWHFIWSLQCKDLPTCSLRRWHVARKSECTAQCGQGYRTLEIYCAKINRADGKTQKVDDRYCSGQRKPDDKEGCHGDCNPGGWEYSSWSEVRTLLEVWGFVCLHWPDVCPSLSRVVNVFTLADAQMFVLQCSKSCGGGTRRRGAVCRKAAEAGGDESKCSQRDKLTVQPCNEFLCPQWKTGDWSEVSLTITVLSLRLEENKTPGVCALHSLHLWWLALGPTVSSEENETFT